MSTLGKRPVLFCVGGGSGIGRGVCVLFGSRGYDVAVVDRDDDAAQQTVKLVEDRAKGEGARGHKRPAPGADASLPGKEETQEVMAAAFHCDVTIGTDVDKAMSQAIAKFHHIDAAVNCAGVEGERFKLAEYPEDVFDRVTAVNYKGVFLCMQREIRQMLAQPKDSKGVRGSIVNISSTAGIRAFPEFSAYAGSKSALLGITRTAAVEYAPEGIIVNAVCPATTDTPMVARFAARWPEWQAKTNSLYPIGRIGSVEEVAEAVFFLASGACSFHVGEQLVIGGGLTC